MYKPTYLSELFPAAAGPRLEDDARRHEDDGGDADDGVGHEEAELELEQRVRGEEVRPSGLCGTFGSHFLSTRSELRFPHHIFPSLMEASFLTFSLFGFIFVAWRLFSAT